MENKSYIVNEEKNKAIDLSLKQAEYLAKRSLQIIAERLAREELQRENKIITPLKLSLRKNKVLKQMMKILKEENKIKKLSNTNIYAVDLHSQYFNWTKEDLKQLYFELHQQYQKISTAKFIFNKSKKLNFYSKFIKKIMVLYPEWEVERLMKLDNYVNDPINGFDNAKNIKNYWAIVNNKLAQIKANDINNDFADHDIPDDYWVKKGQTPPKKWIYKGKEVGQWIEMDGEGGSGRIIKDKDGNIIEYKPVPPPPKPWEREYDQDLWRDIRERMKADSQPHPDGPARPIGKDKNGNQIWAYPDGALYKKVNGKLIPLKKKKGPNKISKKPKSKKPMQYDPDEEMKKYERKIRQ